MSTFFSVFENKIIVTPICQECVYSCLIGFIWVNGDMFSIHAQNHYFGYAVSLLNDLTGGSFIVL